MPSRFNLTAGPKLRSEGQFAGLPMFEIKLVLVAGTTESE
jgi:hypothetical protein